MFAYKVKLLQSYKPVPGPRGKLGIPMGLNLYELLPFWHTFFTRLGFEVVTSGVSAGRCTLPGRRRSRPTPVCFPQSWYTGISSGFVTVTTLTPFLPLPHLQPRRGAGRKPL